MHRTDQQHLLDLMPVDSVFRVVMQLRRLEKLLDRDGPDGLRFVLSSAIVVADERWAEVGHEG